MGQASGAKPSLTTAHGRRIICLTWKSCIVYWSRMELTMCAVQVEEFLECFDTGTVLPEKNASASLG